MKKSILVLTIAIAFLSFAFTPNELVKKEIKTETSQIVWKAYKVTGSHEGTIAIKSGFLSFENNKLVGGEFMIDMNSINCTDMQGEYKTKLENHLNSDDFFSVEKHNSSSLKFTDVKVSGKNSYTVMAEITIKGITKAISFEASIYGNKANATIKIDRTDFDIKYGSASFFDNLKDKAIYDEFDLISDLEF